MNTIKLFSLSFKVSCYSLGRIGAKPVNDLVKGVLTRTITTDSAKKLPVNLANVQLKSLKKKLKKKTSSGKTSSLASFEVKAYTTSESYDLEKIKQTLLSSGAYDVHDIDPDLSDTCLCVKAKYQQVNRTEPRHIFFFDHGSVVFWNLNTDEQKTILTDIKKHEEDSYPDYIVDDESETMSFSRSYVDDEHSAHLSIKRTRLVKDHILFADYENEKSHLLEKFAYSDAITLSIKLGIWERNLEEFTEKTQYIAEFVKSGHTYRIKNQEVHKLFGELFHMRKVVNFNYCFLETPDFYWDRAHLESLYSQLYTHLNIDKRTKRFNDKLNHCIDFMQNISDDLKDRNHTRLEWIIIILISIEVFTAFGLHDYLKKKFISFVGEK